MAQDDLAAIESRLARIEARLQNLELVSTETRRLVGPFAASLGGDKLLVQTLHSLLLIVDAADLILTPQLVAYRQWEPELSQLLWNSCRPETVFVDIGANIGYFTVLAGVRIHAGGTGRVIAVEPNPACCELLERNLVINWSMCDIRLHKCAVGEARGEAWLTTPRDRAANGHLALDGDSLADQPKVRVPVETLDSLAPEGLAVDILKIDVEGYELLAFRGARRVIAQSPRLRILMEWSRKQMIAAGATPLALYEELKGQGLVARRLPASGSLDDLSPANAPEISFEALASLAYDNILLTKGI